MTPAVTTLPPRAESVPLARGFVRGALMTLGAAAACDDAELLVSELATNAVLHARTQFTIAVTRDGPTVRIQVTDLSPVLPRQRSYGEEAATGRGLRLVAGLASAWAAERHEDGKSVWFELPAGGSSASAPAWDVDIDVGAVLAAYDDGGPDAPPVAPRAAA